MLPSVAGNNWQTNGNGAKMRKRFRAGHVFQRGKRCKVWVGCYRERVLDGGELKVQQRKVILGQRSEMTKTQAKKKLLDILDGMSNEQHAPEQTMTFGQFAAKWETEILVHYRASTKRFYKETLSRWILPYFKDWKLSDMKTPELQMFINKFADYSRSVIKHIRATLSVLMRTGVDWEYVERNPVPGVKLPPGKPVKRAPVVPVERLGHFIARLPEPYRTMAVLGTTGMRESEILGLRWDDFDTEKQVVRVRRSQYRGQINPTKSEGSERALPYGDIVSDALMRLRTSGQGGKEYLFVTPKGTLFRSSDVGKKAFRTAAKELELPELTWRSFRRSVETLLHTEGVPMRIQQQILGHTKATTTLLYAEPGIEDRREALGKIQSQLLPNVAKLQLELQLEAPK
jgi:integrase